MKLRPGILYGWAEAVHDKAVNQIVVALCGTSERGANMKLLIWPHAAPGVDNQRRCAEGSTLAACPPAGLQGWEQGQYGAWSAGLQTGRQTSVL